MQYPLDPKAELVKWGPAPGRVYYADWMQGEVLLFAQTYPGLRWPDLLQLNKGNLLCVVMEQDAMNRCGGDVFLKEMLPPERREENRAKWREALQALRSKESALERTDMAQLSTQEFVALWRDFQSAVDYFWCRSVVPELANYGSSPILEKALLEHVPAEQCCSVMETLTAPEAPSFYQQEEVELAETNDIAAHQNKYFWLHNSLDHVGVLSAEWFAERKHSLSQDVRKKTAARFDEVRRNKEDVRIRYKLPEDVIDIGEAISDAVHWQDVRKGDMFTFLHYREMLFVEAQRRLREEREDLLTLQSEEIARLLEGEKLQFGIKERREACGFFCDSSAIRAVDSATALAYWDAYIEPPLESDTQELRGIVASKGTGAVRARVRVVRDPRTAADFEQGDVLVASMTTPDYIFVMKRAGAVVTDTGGLMSHAAIVSRELNVTCIVGTKIATRVLKDGDVVEVDADNGTVRKL